MKLTLLGTGTPNPSLTRASSGYLVEAGGATIVFDHGPGAHHRLLETGTRAVDVSHLFFSHFHYDHCLDYPRLVLTRWDQGADRIPDLNVFGPSPLTRMTEQLFGADGVYNDDIRARIEHPASVETFAARGGHPPRRRPAPKTRELATGDVVDLDGVVVRTTEVPHVQPYLTCLAYRIEADGRTLVYSGDSGPSDDLVELASGCDVLVQMCHYRSGSVVGAEWQKGSCGHLEAADVAVRAGAGALVLTHLPSQIDVAGVRERIVSEIAEIYDGHVFWGEDLLVVPMDGPSQRRHDG